MLEKFIKQFELELEVEEPFNHPTPGSYVIALNQGFSITLAPLNQGFSLFCEFGSSPKENEEAFYLQALTGNLFGKGTKGAVLGLNDQGNMLTISQVVDYNIEYKDFKEIVEDFITTIDFWRNALRNEKSAQKS